MNDDFVSYEIAKKLKEKGFKELCLAYYTNDDTLYYNYSHKAGACYKDCYLSHNFMPKDSVSGKFVDAPTISQVLKWLREKHNILISPSVYGNEDGRIWSYSIINIETQYLQGEIPDNVESYEQAALKGIEYVLDNLI